MVGSKSETYIVFYSKLENTAEIHLPVLHRHLLNGWPCGLLNTSGSGSKESDNTFCCWAEICLPKISILWRPISVLQDFSNLLLLFPRGSLSHMKTAFLPCCPYPSLTPQVFSGPKWKSLEKTRKFSHVIVVQTSSQDTCASVFIWQKQSMLAPSPESTAAHPLGHMGSQVTRFVPPPSCPVLLRPWPNEKKPHFKKGKNLRVQ